MNVIYKKKISENEKLELQTYMSKIEKVLLKYQKRI